MYRSELSCNNDAEHGGHVGGDGDGRTGSCVDRVRVNFRERPTESEEGTVQVIVQTICFGKVGVVVGGRNSPFRKEGENLACIRVDIRRKSPEVQAKQAGRMRLSRYSISARTRSRA